MKGRSIGLAPTKLIRIFLWKKKWQFAILITDRMQVSRGSGAQVQAQAKTFVTLIQIEKRSDVR